MRPEELRALGDLAGDGVAAIADQARDVHVAIADRVFAALTAAGLPTRSVRLAHDTIAAGSYGTARALTGAIVRAAAAVGALTRDPVDLPLGASARGQVVLGALGGVWGDRLAERGSVLGVAPALIVDDRRGHSGHLVVFVHGLGETEHAWHRHAERHPPYGDRLAELHGVTPVYVRYNSGLAIEHSGAALALALAAAVDSWPTAVDEISLVGHSMGGLVARAACHHGRSEQWSERVRRTVYLGSPHEGAELARAAAAAERAFGRLPETRPFAAPLRARSAGIRDLEDGSSLPLATGAEHYFVSASVSREPEALAGRLVGDLLVSRTSAWGRRTRRERLRFELDHYRHLAAATHFDLLNHPAVAELLCEWIGAPRPALGAPRPALSAPAATQRP